MSLRQIIEGKSPTARIRGVGKICADREAHIPLMSDSYLYAHAGIRRLAAIVRVEHLCKNDYESERSEKGE